MSSGERRLLAGADLERSSVVANSQVNRERGLSGRNSYERELGFDPLDWLLDRAGPARRLA